ncbi:MAG: ABC transporter ATP-binding protein [Treponema sp.]|jgi:energy-coupling factor transport system ATP-binding protein|nr:ABC transporter ATP-binding protein [Treponema sp.]
MGEGRAPAEKPDGFRASSLIAFRNFSFTYQSQSEPTLYHIDLEIKRGEKVLILGPSGSGKSTLIHCINGLIPHAFKGQVSGELAILGKDAAKLGIFDISKKIGTVLQDTDGQFVGLSAAEDIAFALENDCVPTEEMRRRVREAARLVGMESFLEQSPHDLSGGQKQRVSIAGVLLGEMEALLFDEPLANLDPAAGKDTIEFIDRLHKKTGKTILIVEHRLEDVLHRSVDRIILIDKGRIAADLPPAELLSGSLLRETGIREPLYLSALRLNGIVISAGMKPESLESLDADFAPLLAWKSGVQTEAPAPPAAGPPLLEVRRLSFSYGETSPSGGAANEADGWALRDISFSVGRGERLSLVGNNGAGKSTLAKLICGFVNPAADASLFFEGRDLAKLSIMERAEHIGYVMQNPNQMISFPLIYDETAFGLRMRGTGEGEIRDRVHHVLETCGLYPFRNWPVGALSYGQKKRLTIASILILEPRFIILDEPTAGQDLRRYSEFMEFLLGLSQKRGLSLLLITHDMHLMLEYSGRALVLSRGRLLADAVPADALTDDALIARASLKRTSLYDLAIKAGLPEPRAFVRAFIACERAAREQAGTGAHGEGLR